MTSACGCEDGVYVMPESPEAPTKGFSMPYGQFGADDIIGSVDDIIGGVATGAYGHPGYGRPAAPGGYGHYGFHQRGYGRGYGTHGGIQGPPPWWLQEQAALADQAAQAQQFGAVMMGADIQAPVHPAALLPPGHPAAAHPMAPHGFHHGHHPHHGYMAQYGGFAAPSFDPEAHMRSLLAMRHAAALEPRPLTRSREYAIGFNNAPVGIVGGNTSILTASPQVPFKGRRLIIPSDVAGALQINTLVVGKNPALVSASPVSARAFTEQGVGVDLNMDTAQIAQLISLSLTNNSGAQVFVVPTIIGTAVE